VALLWLWGAYPLAINTLWGGSDIALKSHWGGLAGFATPDSPAAREQDKFLHMSTQELLLEEIKLQPEPVLLEVWHYLKALRLSGLLTKRDV
jgi:hypothetical protein